jgi:hypothetical protein
VPIFAASVAALLLMLPEPEFTGATLSSRASTSDVPMDFDDPQTVELRIQAQSAMNTLSERSQKKIAQEYLVQAHATEISKG